MDTKQLACMDEELSIEITKPNSEDKDNDLIITVSFTRTYVFTDDMVVLKNNGRRLNENALGEFHPKAM